MTMIKYERYISVKQMRLIHLANFVVQRQNIDSHRNPKHQGPLLLTWFNFNPSMDK